MSGERLRLATVVYGSADETAEAVGRVVASDGAALVREVSCDDGYAALRALALALGDVSTDDVTVPLDADAHAVAALPSPKVDPRGWTILSTTAEGIPCHTDEYPSANPPDLVLLLCVRQSRSGGESRLAFLSDVLPQLSPAAARALGEPHFPSPSGPRPILRSRADGSAWIAYNPHVIRALLGQAEHLSASGAAALGELDAAIARATKSLLLARGECLVLDNHVVLHGRAAFLASDARLLVRMRARRGWL